KTPTHPAVPRDSAPNASTQEWDPAKYGPAVETPKPSPHADYDAAVRFTARYGMMTMLARRLLNFGVESVRPHHRDGLAYFSLGAAFEGIVALCDPPGGRKPS